LGKRRQTGHLDQPRKKFVHYINDAGLGQDALIPGNKMIASNAGWIKRNAPSRETFCILALLSMLIVVTALLMIGMLEPELVLPAFSILLFAAAATVAIVARGSSENVENVTLWDIAGAFTMMGCAAAIFSEPDQVALFFEQPVEQHPDRPL
jgi:hypothetical protein